MDFQRGEKYSRSRRTSQSQRPSSAPCMASAWRCSDSVELVQRVLVGDGVVERALEQVQPRDEDALLGRGGVGLEVRVVVEQQDGLGAAGEQLRGGGRSKAR